MAGFAKVQSLLVNVCVLLVTGFFFSSGQTTTSKNVICYYYSNYEYDDSDGLSVPDIDVSICTHLVYYYAYLPPDRLVFQEYPENKPMSAVLEQLVDLRRSKPSLKILLAVLGLEPRNAKVRLSYENRQIFYAYLLNLLRSWDLDGVNFLWNYYPYEDIVTIAKEMRTALTDEATSSGREPLIFMLRLPGFVGSMVYAEEVDFQALGEAVDILHVTLRDDDYPVQFYHTTTSLANPLYGNGGYRGNVSASITYYLDPGVAAEKLHMGVILSPTLFSLRDPQLTGVGAPVYKVYGHLDIPYDTVCKRLQVEGYTAEVDPEGLVNFAYKGNSWMTYEDTASLEKKMNYVFEHNLGGVAVEFLNTDDFTGEGCNQGKYPLTSTLYRLASSGNS